MMELTEQERRLRDGFPTGEPVDLGGEVVRAGVLAHMLQSGVAIHPLRLPARGS